MSVVVSGFCAIFYSLAPSICSVEPGAGYMQKSQELERKGFEEQQVSKHDEQLAQIHFLNGDADKGLQATQHASKEGRKARYYFRAAESFKAAEEAKATEAKAEDHLLSEKSQKKVTQAQASDSVHQARSQLSHAQSVASQRKQEAHSKIARALARLKAVKAKSKQKEHSAETEIARARAAQQAAEKKATRQVQSVESEILQVQDAIKAAALKEAHDVSLGESDSKSAQGTATERAAAAHKAEQAQARKNKHNKAMVISDAMAIVAAIMSVLVLIRWRTQRYQMGNVDDPGALKEGLLGQAQMPSSHYLTPELRPDSSDLQYNPVHLLPSKFQNAEKFSPALKIWSTVSEHQGIKTSSPADSEPLKEPTPRFGKNDFLTQMPWPSMPVSPPLPDVSEKLQDEPEMRFSSGKKVASGPDPGKSISSQLEPLSPVMTKVSEDCSPSGVFGSCSDKADLETFKDALEPSKQLPGHQNQRFAEALQRLDTAALKGKEAGAATMPSAPYKKMWSFTPPAPIKSVLPPAPMRKEAGTAKNAAKMLSASQSMASIPASSPQKSPESQTRSARESPELQTRVLPPASQTRKGEGRSASDSPKRGGRASQYPGAGSSKTRSGVQKTESTGRQRPPLPEKTGGQRPTWNHNH